MHGVTSCDKELSGERPAGAMTGRSRGPLPFPARCSGATLAQAGEIDAVDLLVLVKAENTTDFLACHRVLVRCRHWGADLLHQHCMGELIDATAAVIGRR